MTPNFPEKNWAILDEGQRFALEWIIQECARQRHVEDWSIEHDDQHDRGEMALAAASYAILAATHKDDPRYGALAHMIKQLWPWADEWFKPKPAIHNLKRSAALSVAEIARLHRKMIRDFAGDRP